jgi:hypothetical protein
MLIIGDLWLSMNPKHGVLSSRQAQIRNPQCFQGASRKQYRMTEIQMTKTKEHRKGVK